ncbi:sugar phosphate isomerase/epimerase [Candidatus Bathyarchaeota archaeon]|nr:sugar phosphate isomerase/epimerase [Candidatus Bathyarchaeota archaeon]
MDIAMETGSLVTEGFSLRESIEAALKLGFKAVELWMDKNNLWPLSASKEEIESTRDMLKSMGIRCISTCPIPFKAESWEIFSFEFNLADPNDRDRSRAVEFFKRAIDISAQLGAELVLIPPGKIEQPNFMQSKVSYRKYMEQLVRSIRECATHALDLGLTLGIENTVVGNFCDTPYELKRAVERTALRNVKVYLDVANANIFHPPVEYILELKDLLANCIHITDNDGSYAYHLPIGMGSIDFLEVVSTLREIGWDGYLIPEIFYKDNPLEGLRISKERLEGLL